MAGDGVRGGDGVGDGGGGRDVGAGGIELMQRIMRETAAERAGGGEVEVYDYEGGGMEAYEDEEDEAGELGEFRVNEGRGDDGRTWKERQLTVREEAQVIVEKGRRKEKNRELRSLGLVELAEPTPRR